jgi:glycosyltransferase involved in cell wall biosynthesis
VTVRLHINAVGAVMGGAARHLPAFVGALVEVRPDWEITAYVSPGAPDLSGPLLQLQAVSARSWQRILWDSVSVGRRAGRDQATALLNLTNYGPLRPPIPSILYQRNPVYFDPVWVRRMPYLARADAMARRQLAFQQMRGSAATVVPTNAMAAYLRSWKGHPTSARVVVIPHAVNVDRFAFNTHQPRTPLQLVSLSHAAPHKGQELLIELMVELRRRGTDALLRATIADEDDRRYVGDLRTRIAAAGLSHQIELVGRVDAASFLASADIMVLPSVTESFGFPLIEAMASGVPVLASFIPSTTEILGHLGWCFPVGDPSAAADRVAEVVSTPPETLAKRLVAARSLATTYTWRRNAEQIANLVEVVSG